MALVCAAYVSAETTSNVSDLLNPLITGVPSLSIGPDAVAGGMGDIGTATVPDNNSQHWNSSKYAQMPSSAGFTMSYTPWLRSLGVNDIDLAYLSGYYQISQLAGTVSASLRFFSLGKIDLRDNIDATPISVKPYEIAFDAGYERMLSEHFSMGVVFRFICSDLSARQEDYYPGYAFGADINGYYELPIDIRMGTSKFAFGFNISNLGTKVSYDKGNTSNFLPTDLRLGVSYLLPFDRYNRLSFNFEADKLLVPSRKSKFAKNYDPNDESTWTQNIQLQQVMVNGMIFKMGRNNWRILVVCRCAGRCQRRVPRNQFRHWFGICLQRTILWTRWLPQRSQKQRQPQIFHFRCRFPLVGIPPRCRLCAVGCTK